MGSRATIRIKHSNNDTAIHFYTHWSGGEVDRILATALLEADKAGRISDESYASRIIFDTLTQLEGGSTGYGIIIGDENRPFDVGYDSPSVEWRAFGQHPYVRYYDLSGRLSRVYQPWKEWVADVLHDLTSV